MPSSASKKLENHEGLQTAMLGHVVVNPTSISHLLREAKVGEAESVHMRF